MGNNNMRESALYADVLVDGLITDGLEGSVATLGTHYVRASGDFTLTATSPDGESVVLASPQEVGTTIQIRDGDVVGVTGLTDGTASYTLSLSEASEDTIPEDSGDSGSGDSGSGDPGDSGAGDSGVDWQPDGITEEGSGKACGCASGGWWGGVGWLVGLLLVGLRRREC